MEAGALVVVAERMAFAVSEWIVGAVRVVVLVGEWTIDDGRLVILVGGWVVDAVEVVVRGRWMDGGYCDVCYCKIGGYGE